MIKEHQSSKLCSAIRLSESSFRTDSVAGTDGLINFGLHVVVMNLLLPKCQITSKNGSQTSVHPPTICHLLGNNYFINYFYPANKKSHKKDQKIHQSHEWPSQQ